MRTMGKLFIAAVAAASISLPLASLAGPDEAQRQMIQRTQEAKKKLAAAQAAQGAERQQMMRDHMKMMQEMMTQMRKAEPRAGMSPEQMREWIGEHLKLMNEMMSQMMDEHHMMMQGMDAMGGKQPRDKK